MTQAQTNKFLPEGRDQAMQAMIKITKRLLDVSEREGQALATSNLINFTVLQDEKSYLAERYISMSSEFRERINEFRGIDRGVLDRLEALQKQLGEYTRGNNQAISRMRANAQKNTQSTLLSAQELATKRPVEFEKDTAQNT